VTVAIVKEERQEADDGGGCVNGSEGEQAGQAAAAAAAAVATASEEMTVAPKTRMTTSETEARIPNGCEVSVATEAEAVAAAAAAAAAAAEAEKIRKIQRVVNDEELDWHKRAVFYEVFVRGFSDSDGDGIGDLRGLTGRLDHLAWLGVDVVWLLPIIQSPLRDHGYDVSDATRVHQDYGTLEDFDELVAAAHARGIRVVVELVPNHTSSSHPWFQASRDPAHPLHAKYRDWYLWSETEEALQGTRIIFIDSERSNWEWDEKRGAYYFHRFFSHQPDLNMDNPAVQAAVLGIIDFWAARGVDGIRVDAAPFLFKREGTTSESLPETHAFFQRMRRYVDERAVEDIARGNTKRRRRLMLICEANQWPREAAAFFGQTGRDEFSMAFHFPLMPRVFISLAQESSAAVAWALAETPELPGGGQTGPAQWGTFLRNHDELTLEMVTDEERDFLWRKYAPDPRMRLNLGIRRRLAPLLGNDGTLIRLAHSVLLSSAGSPFLYYGDEIGMGDNIELADRSGVRTPMQWDSNAETNAGFSRAPPSQLYLPLITHGEYGFRKVNVAAQRADPQSLLNWLRNALHLRAANSRTFGRGVCSVLGVSDGVPDSALVFFRGFGVSASIDPEDVEAMADNMNREADCAIIAVHNLSSTQRLVMTLSARNVLVPRLLAEEVDAAVLRRKTLLRLNASSSSSSSSSTPPSTLLASSPQNIGYYNATSEMVSTTTSSSSSTTPTSTSTMVGSPLTTETTIDNEITFAMETLINEPSMTTTTSTTVTAAIVERRMSLVGGEQRSIEATELFTQQRQRIAPDGALHIDLPQHGFAWIRLRFITPEHNPQQQQQQQQQRFVASTTQ